MPIVCCLVPAFPFLLNPFVSSLLSAVGGITWADIALMLIAGRGSQRGLFTV